MKTSSLSFFSTRCTLDEKHNVHAAEIRCDHTVWAGRQHTAPASIRIRSLQIRSHGARRWRSSRSTVPRSITEDRNLPVTGRQLPESLHENPGSFMARPLPTLPACPYSALCDPLHLPAVFSFCVVLMMRLRCSIGRRSGSPSTAAFNITLHKSNLDHVVLDIFSLLGVVEGACVNPPPSLPPCLRNSPSSANPSAALSSAPHRR